MTTQLTPGDTAYYDYGTPERVILQIRVDRHWDGVAVTVVTPADTNLRRTFTNDRLDDARGYLAFLRDAATAGKPVWQIEAEVSVILAAAEAVAA